jgi:class 3 adenylate cyclase
LGERGERATGEPPLEIVIALHYGTVIYGKVGAADRLDLTPQASTKSLYHSLLLKSGFGRHSNNFVQPRSTFSSGANGSVNLGNEARAL